MNVWNRDNRVTPHDWTRAKPLLVLWLLQNVASFDVRLLVVCIEEVAPRDLS